MSIFQKSRLITFTKYCSICLIKECEPVIYLQQQSCNNRQKLYLVIFIIQMRQCVIIVTRIELALSLQVIESTNLLPNHFKTKDNLNKFTLRDKLSLNLIWNLDVKMVDCSFNFKQVFYKCSNKTAHVRPFFLQHYLIFISSQTNVSPVWRKIPVLPPDVRGRQGKGI